MVPELAFPNHERGPADLLKPLEGRRITGLVPLQLHPPIVRSGFRDTGTTAARMLVPEAPVDEDGFLPSGKDDVWAPRQILAVKAVPVPVRPQKRSKPHLGRGVRRPIRAHGGTNGVNDPVPLPPRPHQMSGMAEATALNSGGGTAFPTTR